MTLEHKVGLTFEGADRIDIACRSDEDVITAALRQGFLLLTECREGSCATCRGFLADGEYDELLPHSSHALTDLEEEEGYVLACRLRPSSDLEIEFDYPFDRVGRYEEGTRTGHVVTTERLSETVARMVVRTAAAQDPLEWDPGQYVQITMPAVGATRAYSMANTADGSRELELLIRLLPDGQFSGHLAAGLATGEPVRIRGPFGHFTFRSDSKPVFIAGGTGLAPILAILRALARTAPTTEASLVFGVAGETELFCRDELDDLGRIMPNLKVVTTVERPTETWSGAEGLVSEWLGPLDPARSYYLCGPPGMIGACEAQLIEHGVPRDHIHAERFLETGEQRS